MKASRPPVVPVPKRAQPALTKKIFVVETKLLEAGPGDAGSSPFHPATFPETHRHFQSVSSVHPLWIPALAPFRDILLGDQCSLQTARCKGPPGPPASRVLPLRPGFAREFPLLVGEVASVPAGLRVARLRAIFSLRFMGFSSVS